VKENAVGTNSSVLPLHRFIHQVASTRKKVTYTGQVEQGRQRAASRMQKKSASSILASFRPSTLNRSSSEVGSNVGAFPLATTHCKGERPTRGAVCTSSALHSL
jgi:hypothetical protein